MTSVYQKWNVFYKNVNHMFYLDKAVFGFKYLLYENC